MVLSIKFSFKCLLELVINFKLLSEFGLFSNDLEIMLNG